MLKKLKAWWMVFVHALGKVQTAILLSVVYHLTVGPLALVSKITGGDLLDLRAKAQPSYAKTLNRISSTIAEAEKQF
jgi:hypothetical protein